MVLKLESKPQTLRPFWGHTGFSEASTLAMPYQVLMDDGNIIIIPQGNLNFSFLSMKRQWTYGPTLWPWNNHFHTYDEACLKLSDEPCAFPYMGGTDGVFKFL